MGLGFISVFFCLNFAWTCEAAGGAACPTAAGTGLPNLNAGAMPEGSHLTYKITGTPTAQADYAQMPVEAEPLGEAGELDPEKDKATATTDLTPLFNKAPSFARDRHRAQSQERHETADATQAQDPDKDQAHARGRA